MKSILSTFYAICLTSFFSFGQDTLHTLDFNNVNATISNSGIFFTDPNTFNAGYEIPKGGGVYSIYSGASWFVAEDASGNILTSLGANESGSDVDRGPYSTNNSYADPSYDDAFMISLCQDEIDNFILWWECENGVTTTWYAGVFQPSSEILNSIYNWPAHGDVSLGQEYYLAPFYDRDSDGTYDPIVSGDYPLIKGCCATYMIQNDAGNIHTLSGTDPIGIEMHYLFYHFGANSLLYNTTFVDVMAINKSQTDYVDFKHSFFVDADLGSPFDDYIGSDSVNNMLYFYNADNNDEPQGGGAVYGVNPPAIGIVGLATPVSSVVRYDNSSTPSENFDLMSGLQASGAPWTDMNGDATKFLYSGNPNDVTQWSEMSLNNLSGDRRGLISTNYGAFNSGDTATQTYAIIYSRIGNNLENAEHLSTLAADVQAFYDSGDDGCDAGGFLGTPELESTEITIYPNPNNGVFTIESTAKELKSIQVFDLAGKEVDFVEEKSGSGVKILLQSVNSGVYIVSIETSAGNMIKRLIVE